jgi:hypothetical protein
MATASGYWEVQEDGQAASSPHAPRQLSRFMQSVVATHVEMKVQQLE